MLGTLLLSLAAGTTQVRVAAGPGAALSPESAALALSSPPRMHAQAYTLVGQGACRGAGGALDKVNSRSKAGLDKARPRYPLT